jgi:hypothetical protein
MLLGDDEDEIQIIQLTEQDEEEPQQVERRCKHTHAPIKHLSSDLSAAYPPMPDWMAAGKPSAKTVEPGLDLEAQTMPARKITLGRLVPPAAPTVMTEAAPPPAHEPRQRDPHSPVQVDSSGVVDVVDDEEEEIVELEELDSSPVRPSVPPRQEARRASPRQRSRQGLIDTQPRMEENLPMGTASLPASPPRLTIPPRLSMQRSISMNNSFAAPIPSPNPDRTVEQEEIEDLGEREETPAPRGRPARVVPQGEGSRPMSRQTSYHAVMDDDDDDEIVPVELEPVPMPASPPPEAIPIPGIDRTYSMAQPMANMEPPSKSYKQANSIVAKARAEGRTHKGSDAPVAKKGKGRDADKDDGPDLKKELSKLDNEVSITPIIWVGPAYSHVFADHFYRQTDQTATGAFKTAQETA